jgi:hypothetical protein
MTSKRKVFITGASGLVGEEVLRRMLVDDPALEAFVLVRDEIRWLLASRRLGALARRVVPLPGDATLPGLGLDSHMRQRVERRHQQSYTRLLTRASPGRSTRRASSTRSGLITSPKSRPNACVSIASC